MGSPSDSCSFVSRPRIECPPLWGRFPIVPGTLCYPVRARSLAGSPGVTWGSAGNVQSGKSPTAGPISSALQGPQGAVCVTFASSAFRTPKQSCRAQLAS